MKLTIHDATLRDGNHAVRHQLDRDQLVAYATAADEAGIPIVEVGHGNGLGASSLQVGLAKLTDHEMLEAVRPCLNRARMAAFVLPGWGTNQDLRGAIERGVDVVRVGAHCTESDLTRRHLGTLAEAGVEGQGVLLMSHMATPEQLAEHCAAMVDYGARAVGIFDSSGHYMPADVEARITAIVDAVDVPVAFHGHDNLGMAVANSLAAARAGATIIDGCARGFGAGAGNTQLEVVVPVLERAGFETGIALYGLLDAAEVAESRLVTRIPSTGTASIVSGLAGVFSGFRRKVEAAAVAHDVDPRDIFFELGRRQAVAGQEDLIIEVATTLRAATPRD